ncbi:acyl-CoA dehydrogenase [Neobacillus niacini]|uniref:acyl-CoA dehydrogenase family protein n=1 Tax=Neobacillus niacini TaxID=86668 RepID=UPI00285F20C1|nr:acyl-CoA dehydrogenase family protein [Neobacillus niacini]MDR7075762.1 acyl-CoA dehydrogenase [Neobacillus niacini]
MNLLHEADLWNAKMRKFVEEEMVPYEYLLPKFLNELPEDTVNHIFSEMKKQGLWAPSAPKEYGGQSLPSVTYLGWREALGRTALWSVMGVVLENPMYILYSASEKQKERYLYPTIRGEKLGGFAQTEPEAGADPARMTCKATRKGSGWVINGVKKFIGYGGYVDYCLVYAKTDPEKVRDGITCFIVDKNTPGFNPTEQIVTMGGDQPWYISFDDCYVSDEQVLGNIGEGFNIAQTWFTRNRYMLQSPICLGAVTRAIDELLKYFPDKVDPEWLGRIQAEYRRARFLMYNAAYKFDNGEDARFDAALSKLASNKLSMEVFRRALEISGPYGYAVGTVFERYYRDLRRFPITEGSTETMKLLASRSLIRGYEEVDRLSPYNVHEEVKNVSR